jgi:hypothetical protein
VLVWIVFFDGFSAPAGEEDWLSAAVRRNTVNSTNLTSVGYNRESRVLEVEFHAGSVYRYRDVPPQVFEALIRAESKGRYFTRQIRGRYEFRRLQVRQR